MSIKASKLKNSLLNPAKRVGILLAEDSQADRALTRGTKTAAALINKGEKQARRAVEKTKSTLDELRATIHAATAPRRR